MLSLHIKWFVTSTKIFFFTRSTVEAIKTQGKIDLRNEFGRSMKVKVVGEVSEK